jgi:hypothetical protein
VIWLAWVMMTIPLALFVYWLVVAEDDTDRDTALLVLLLLMFLFGSVALLEHYNPSPTEACDEN